MRWQALFYDMVGIMPLQRYFETSLWCFNRICLSSKQYFELADPAFPWHRNSDSLLPNSLWNKQQYIPKLNNGHIFGTRGLAFSFSGVTFSPLLSALLLLYKTFIESEASTENYKILTDQSIMILLHRSIVEWSSTTHRYFPHLLPALLIYGLKL